MNILHVYRTYFPETQGGLEEAIRQICVNTKKHGVHNRVFTLTRETGNYFIKSSEADIYRAKLTFEIASCGMSINAFTNFKEHVNWADVVHYHFPWPFADVLHLFLNVRKPSVVTYHSDIVRQKYYGVLYFPLMKYFLNHVDRIVATSPNYLESSQVLQNYKEKTNVIPLAINKDTYPKITVNDCNSIVSKDLGDYFLFIGVLRYYKGLHILLDAVAEAEYNLVIVGSGPLEAELRAKVHERRLSNVYFVGKVSDIEKVCFIKKSRGIVFPSIARSEAFGVTLLEGLMYGKPLISTEIGTGTSYVNMHAETGYVVPPEDHQALRKAMDKIYKDHALAEKMASNAKLRYQTKFMGETMGKSYFELYDSVRY